MSRMQEILDLVEDHRSALGRRYSLSSVLQLVICGFLCGCDNLSAVVRWSKRLDREQMKSLGFTRYRLPCHSNICVILQGIDASSLETALSRFVRSDTPLSGHLAMDGKVLRGSIDNGKSAHLLACFSEALQGVVEQIPVPEGSNEITAAIALLQRLELHGTVITGDAIFAQQAICRTIRSKGGHYLFTLKDNQKSLKAAAELAFATTKKCENA